MTETTPEREFAQRPKSAFEERLRSWMAASERRFDAQMASDDVLELTMLDIVGEDWWTGGGITSKAVQEKLAAYPKAKTVKVLLNSPGGDAFEGLAIQSLLRRHGANVEVEVVGLAASAASIIAMAGDSIAMHEGSLMMIHEPWTFAVGSAEDMRSTADFLDKVNSSGLDVYTRRTGRDRAAVSELVVAETWMTAHEAVEQKFATSVVEGAAPEKQPSPKARSAAQIFMSTRVARAPRAALALTTTTETPAAAKSPEPQPEPVAPPPPKSPENNPMTQISDATPSIARALGLPMGASEADIMAAATRTRELELQILAVTGVKTSGEALGAMRGINAKAERAEALEAEVIQLKSERDEQNFKALVMKGRSEPVKLTPAMANMYEDRFKAAQAEGRGAAIVEDLRGFLEVAPKVHALSERRDPPRTQGGIGTLTWNGKTYADMKPAERARLKTSDPDLYQSMRQEAQASA